MAALGDLDVTVGPDVNGSAVTGVDTCVLWRSVWESEIDAVFIGTDDGEIVTANPAACELLGWTRDELCRLRRDQVFDMSEPGLREALAERQRTGRARARGVLVRRDGARVPTLLSSVRAELVDGSVVYVTICRDTSEFEDAQAHLDAIVSNTADLLMSIDPDTMQLLWWNEGLRASVESSMGVQLHVGMRASDIFSDPDRASWWTDAVHRCATEGMFTTKYRQDELILDVAFRPITLASGTRAVMAQATDVTSEAHAVAALAANEEKYRSVVASMAEGVVFQTADGRIVETNEAAVAIERRLGDEMIGTRFDAEVWGAVREDGTEFPGREHPSMVTLRTGEPQTGVVMGLRRPGGTPKWISINTQPVHIRSVDDEVAVVTTFHDITDQKRVEAELAEHVDRLERLVQHTLDAVGAIVETRDPYTSGHMARVAELAGDIALELGWSVERRRVLTLAASVHDVGKVAVPLELLTKPTRLTPIEMELVRAHAEHGYQILGRIDFGVPIADIVHQHHEWMDGSGYPLGLRGDQILPEARILSVADVVESMSSHRPYRPALGLDVAVQEITSHRGTRYDPDVVDAFVAMVARGYELRVATGR